MGNLSQDAYTRAGVSQSGADAAVEALVAGLRGAGRESARTVPLPGHYASVVRLDERTGIAITTDGVGTKLLVAERMGRWATVGIDCVAMNVNDLICVGAEPLAMVDYVAVPSADPDVCGAARGRTRARRGAGGDRDPGRRARPARRDGRRRRPLRRSGRGGRAGGDRRRRGASNRATRSSAYPSSGLHSNGYTLARRALAELPLEDDRLGRPLGEILLEPTEIYVRAVLDLLRSPADVRGLAHITGGGLSNLTRLRAAVGYRIEDPLPVPPIFELIAELGDVSDDEMHEVFNMGCGFCCVVAAADAADAVELLRRHYPEAKVIGRATDRAGEVERAR